MEELPAFFRAPPWQLDEEQSVKSETPRNVCEIIREAMRRFVDELDIEFSVTRRPRS
jgi:hypothetical protein